MCGFVGVHRFDGAPVDLVQLADVADVLAHRGPDGHGVWAAGPVGLAHRRLAIIDPSGSEQPLASSDGRLHVVCNGEILNYREVRAALRYDFRTAGDTEVLLALHEQRGERGIPALRGQFAYALHDGNDGSTWLVRDRLGVLPLYYAHLDGAVAFASEVKALLPLLPGRPRVDEASLGEYLRRRAVPAPATLFHGVRKLPAGHLLRVGADGRTEVRAWWSLPYQGTAESIGDAEAIDRVAAALDAAVADSLVADVPVGAYLSGGLDSSLLVAIAARQRDVPLRTFAAGFDDPMQGDLPWARMVSEHLGIQHAEVLLTTSDFAGSWDRLTWHRDAPLSEPADVAVHQLAVAAARDVKVVLSGEGSDELFAGYPKHRLAGMTAHAGTVPFAVRSVASSLAAALPRSAHRARIGLRAVAAGGDETARMEAWFAPFTDGERAALLGVPGATARDGGRPVPAAAGDPLRRMLLGDAGSWLADNLLERGDRMTMAASVELRPPFLDHRLVELAFRLPSRVKQRRGTGKWVLRRVAEPLLPRAVLERPKSGFRVPLDRWFRTGLREMAWDRLLSSGSFVTSVFDRAAVRAVLERHDRSRADEEMRIWTLLALEVWHDACIRSAFEPGPRVAA
jgi:asparagine synthase (glutamine-hydrolysing)